MKKTLSWLLALATMLVAGMVLAKGKGVVIIAEGADADSVRRDLAQSMPNGLAAQDSSNLTSALAAQGVNGSLADALSTPKGRKKTLVAVKKALAQAGVAGVISARGKKSRTGGKDVRLVLILDSQLEPVIEENIALGKGEKGKDKYAPLLSAPLADVAPAGKEEPAPAASSESKEKEEASASASESVEASSSEKDTGPAKKRGATDFTNALVVVDVGPQIGGRLLKFTNKINGVRDYSAPGVAMIGVAVELYPGAQTGQPIAKDIGIVGRYGRALSWDSKTKSGDSAAKAEWQYYNIGVRGRIKAGDTADSPLVGLELTYGDADMNFTTTDLDLANTLPSVHYKYARPGADIRIPFGAFSLLGGAGYRYIFSTGRWSERFPHESIAGVDARVSAAYAVTPSIAAKVSGEYDRIFSTTHPKVEDLAAGLGVAGGALDQYLIVQVGVSAIF